MLRLLLASMMLVALLAAPAGALAANPVQPTDGRTAAASPRPTAAGPVQATAGPASTQHAPPRALSDSGVALSGSDLVVIVAGGLTLLLVGSLSRRLPGPLA